MLIYSMEITRFENMNLGKNGFEWVDLMVIQDLQIKLLRHCIWKESVCGNVWNSVVRKHFYYCTIIFLRCQVSQCSCHLGIDVDTVI